MANRMPHQGARLVNLSDLPDEHDRPAIFKFATSFNGFEHIGSFERAADAAKSGDRSSLNLIRNELFFTARASRHRDDQSYVTKYRELLPLLQQHAGRE